MTLSRILTRLENSIITAGASRFLGRCVKTENGIRVKIGCHELFAKSPDRVLALYLYKFSMMGKFESEFFKGIINPGMTVVDIGANLGYYTILLADCVGVNGRVFSFEPEPGQYALLLKNIQANHCANAIAIPKAVSNQSGRIVLWLNKANQGDHRIYDPADGRPSIEIEATTLDHFLSERDWPKIDFIKMDIQGAEFLALAGMKETIKKNPAIMMLCEFCPDKIIQAGSTTAKFLAQCRDYGFDISHLNEGKKKVEKISTEELLKVSRRETYMNLFLKR